MQEQNRRAAGTSGSQGLILQSRACSQSPSQAAQQELLHLTSKNKERTLRPGHLSIPLQSCPPFAVPAPWQSSLSRGRGGCMAPGCPAGPSSGLQSQAATSPKTPSSSGTPRAPEPQALPFLPFFTSMCPAVLHAVKVGKSPRGHASFTSRCRRAQHGAATGAVWSLPPCQNLALTLLPGTNAVQLPALILHCPRMGQGAGHRGDIPSHSSSWASLGSPDPWLAPQPPNPLCLSSAAHSQQEFAESHEHSVPRLTPAGRGQKTEV